MPLLALAAMHASARTIVSLDEDWQFLQADAPGAESPDFDTSSWRTLDVPHDWSIEGKFDQNEATQGSGGWLPSGVAWYRKEITTPPGSEGKRFWVEFDGVMANSEVWLNGKSLGRRPSGYTSFNHDLTEHLKPDGKDILVVRADTSAQPASRWYTGAGIYRLVRLVIAHRAHVAHWGVFVSTPEVSAAAAMVKIQTTLKNTAEKSSEITLRSILMGPDGKTISTVNSAATTLPAGE